MNPKMRYNREDDVLMIWFAEDKSIDRAEHVGNTIMHVSAQGDPVLLEVLHARAFVVELVRATLFPPNGGTTDRPGNFRRARGVLPISPGDPMPEDAIRRLRDAW